MGLWRGRVTKRTTYKGAGKLSGASSRSWGCLYYVGLTKDGQASDVIPVSQCLQRESGWKRVGRGSEEADGNYPA